MCSEAVENGAQSCLEDGGQGPITLLISGSPCDPFSVNRMGKRWAPGDIQAHTSYDVTMESVIKVYSKYSPVVGVMEQVAGFTMPFSQANPETPYSRRELNRVQRASLCCELQTQLSSPLAARGPSDQ